MQFGRMRIIHLIHRQRIKNKLQISNYKPLLHTSILFISPCADYAFHGRIGRGYRIRPWQPSGSLRSIDIERANSDHT